MPRFKQLIKNAREGKSMRLMNAARSAKAMETTAMEMNSELNAMGGMLMVTWMTMLQTL